MVGLGTRLRDVVGGTTATKLADGLDLHTVGDLLRHYPRRYWERGDLTPFAELEVGAHATVFCEVVSSKGRTIRKNLHLTELTVQDRSGRRMTVALFNQRWAEGKLLAGRQVVLSGKVETFNSRPRLHAPKWSLVDGEDAAEEWAGAIVPVYPASASVDSPAVARCVRTVLDVVELGDDPLPERVRSAHGFPGLREALAAVHRPVSRPALDAAYARLRWEEAFVLQVVLAQRRREVEQLPGTPRVPRPGGLLDAFDARLPFPLTAGQREVGEELLAELARDRPMHRLLQGDVGSGKTVVALRAMLAVVDSGGQAALLAPTEVLAQQHARSIRELLGPLGRRGQLDGDVDGTRVALLTGSQGAAARRQALLDAASGDAGVVVGTHAMLQEHVQFQDLGLVVVDEQHRFGVEQRDALRAKGRAPHVLVMTATPIPRTVAMTVYGDLETSTLRDLPPGRSPVTTHVVPAGNARWTERLWQVVREAAARGERSYVVCPRIGDGDDAPAGDEPRTAAVVELAPLLAEGPLTGLRLDVLHGRMAPEAKDLVMSRFAEGDVEVLVATTVVEVGVDVPSATVMVVVDAERFGVSQLHQLRGRVGRASLPSSCFLVTSTEPGSPSFARLEAVASTTDGFALAGLDLAQRREGDVLGKEQSGTRSSLRLLSLLEHVDVIVEARAEATRLVADDPALERHPALARAVADLVDPERAAYLEKG